MSILLSVQNKIMTKLPQHRAALLSDFGIRVRKMTMQREDDTPVSYLHQDDYYVFGLVEEGTCRFMIDFKEQQLNAGEMVIIQPGQVHNYISSERMAGTSMIVDVSYVSPDYKRIFDEYSFDSAPFCLGEARQKELLQLLEILQARLDGKSMRSISRSLAEACVGIVAETLEEVCKSNPRSGNPRQKEITMAFRSLLERELPRHHQPSWYASQLNISNVYLNEVVRQVTSQNVSTYIRAEIMLRAKRMLAYTDTPVKEIAYSLGFDDNAYFSRLFTQTVGVSPTVFRAQY